jgi:hypothetical protein
MAHSTFRVIALGCCGGGVYKKRTLLISLGVADAMYQFFKCTGCIELQ